MKHRLEDYPGAGELTLWYEKPAHTDYKGWEQQALPIGNGYMGAKVFGGIRREQIQFNEKTLCDDDACRRTLALLRETAPRAMRSAAQGMITARRCMKFKICSQQGKMKRLRKRCAAFRALKRALAPTRILERCFLIFPACVSAPVGNIAARLICARLFPALALRTRGCATLAPAL